MHVDLGNASDDSEYVGRKMFAMSPSEEVRGSVVVDLVPSLMTSLTEILAVYRCLETLLEQLARPTVSLASGISVVAGFFIC